MMDDPKLYEKVNHVQRRDTEVILEQMKIKWRPNVRVLDIGCGDGGVTVNILKKYLPVNFEMLLGCDSNQRCVDYARQHYGSERVQFRMLDIQGDVPVGLKGSFDHVFSFYTFHWVRQQVTAFRNVYDMLADSGSCLIHFVGRTTVHEVYEKLARKPKWMADLKNIHTDFISPYFDSQDPANEVRNIMENVGFKDVQVKVFIKTYSFEADEFKKLMKSLNPFDGLIPKWDEFMADYDDLDVTMKTATYTLIVAYGSK